MQLLAPSIRFDRGPAAGMAVARWSSDSILSAWGQQAQGSTRCWLGAGMGLREPGAT